MRCSTNSKGSSIIYRRMPMNCRSSLSHRRKPGLWSPSVASFACRRDAARPRKVRDRLSGSHNSMQLIAASLFFVGSLLFLSVLVEQPSTVSAIRPTATPTPLARPRIVSSAVREPDLGPGASLHGKQVFPLDNPWNQDISKAPLDPNSNRIIAAIGADDRLHPDFGTVYRGVPNGIPYTVVAGSQRRVPVYFRNTSESDQSLYPLPPNAPIE